jgi:hypothetical protein
MRLKTRTVEIAGITCQPNEAWMKQTARKLTDPQDGFLRSVRYLILDRDPLYTTAFRRMLRDSGVKPLLLPARSPNLKRLCGKVRPIRQVRMPGANRPSRREAPPGCRPRVRGPLP